MLSGFVDHVVQKLGERFAESYMNLLKRRAGGLREFLAHLFDGNGNAGFDRMDRDGLACEEAGVTLARLGDYRRCLISRDRCWRRVLRGHIDHTQEIANRYCRDPERESALDALTTLDALSIQRT